MTFSVSEKKKHCTPHSARSVKPLSAPRSPIRTIDRRSVCHQAYILSRFSKKRVHWHIETTTNKPDNKKKNKIHALQNLPTPDSVDPKQTHAKTPEKKKRKRISQTELTTTQQKNPQSKPAQESSSHFTRPHSRDEHERQRQQKSSREHRPRRNSTWRPPPPHLPGDAQSRQRRRTSLSPCEQTRITHLRRGT